MNARKLSLLAVSISLLTASAADTNIIGWRWQNSTIETNAPQMPTKVIALAGSDYHCVALLADRTVRAWGRNTNGETNVPPDLSNVVGVAAGDMNSLAVNAEGQVRMWGRMSSTLQPPFVPANVTNVVALGVGRGALHAVALRADGTVVDWGWAAGPIPYEAFNIVSVAAGSTHTLALRSDGRVISWGRDYPYYPSAVPISATNIVAIAAGDGTSVAVRADGRLLVWGNILSAPSTITNAVEAGCFQSGGGIALQGNGTVIGWGAPVTIRATNCMTIGADSWGALAVKASGPPIFPFPAARRTVASGQTAFLRHRVVGALPIAFQWRFDGTNLLGATNSVLAVTNVLPAKAGLYTLVASNGLGVITNSEMELLMVPIILENHPTNQAVFVGANPTLRVTALGQSPVYQWSHNGSNISWGTNSSLTLTNIQLAQAGIYSVAVSNEFGGVVSSNAFLTVEPILVTQLPKDLVTFEGGTAVFSITALANTPLSYQWRFNGTDLPGATEATLALTNLHYEQAGNYEVVASTTSSTVTNVATLAVVPVAAWGLNSFGQTKVPADLTNVIALAGGSIDGSALKDNGRVVVWGASAGDPRRKVPEYLTNAVAVSAGSGHYLALRADGTVAAWGHNNQGQTNVPPHLTNAVAVAAGGYHSLVLRVDGTVVGWGQNNSGQASVPVGLINVVAIAAHDAASLALTADGHVIGWGYNGTGITNVPGDLSNVVAIAAGRVHSIALKSDGTVRVWGWTNSYDLRNIPAAATNIVAVRAGYGHCLVLRDDGTVIAWGYPYNGETEIPSGLQHVTAIAAGDFHSLALVGDAQRDPQVPVMNPAWSDTGFSIVVPTMSGRVYRLECKDNLSDGAWTAHALVAGTGGPVTFTDSTATGSQRFYRVRKW
jgi:alpha-tubulin suppressor-like RCC1 family protein